MKRGSLLVVLSLLVTANAGAKEIAQMLPPDGTTVAMLCAAINQHRDGRFRPITNVIEFEGSDFAFVIPVAGNLQGGGGTFFHSDISLANNRSVTQRIGIAFLQRSVNSGNDQITIMTLPANSVTDIDDFIATRLGKIGLGALLISGQKSDGTVDSDAILDGFSRIWTLQPGSSGGVSQSLSSVPIQDSLVDSMILGLKQNAAFRTNVGVVNTSGNNRTFNMSITGTGGTTSFTVTTPPYSMNQVSVPAGNWGNFSITVGTPAADFDWWTAYGTSVDNVTGDGWVSHAH